MKAVVTLILGILLLWPGIAPAANRMSTQAPQPALTAEVLPQKLDLNRVTLEELVDIPGIGPRMARAIIELRTKKGSFDRVEDLLEVTGIKEKKLASISGYLEVVPLPTATSAPGSLPSR